MRQLKLISQRLKFQIFSIFKTPKAPRIPNIYIPNINIPSLDQPSIFNEVKVNPTPIMLEVKAYNWLIITNMIVSILALAVAIYSMRH